MIANIGNAAANRNKGALPECGASDLIRVLAVIIGNRIYYTHSSLQKKLAACYK